MKLILKVLLAISWSLNLFASEDNPAFLALNTLNTESTKDLVTIIRNERTSPQTKVNAFSRVVNGLTLTREEKVFIADYLDDLKTKRSDFSVRVSFFNLCSSINSIIKELGVEQEFLPETVSLGLSAGQIFATWAFIKLFVYRFFTSEYGRNKVAITAFETTNIIRIVKAYAP